MSLFDAVVIGGGIAGATAAYHLSADRRVALVEAEEAAGYHTTGRSAALWVANGGPEYERTLALESFLFLLNPPDGFLMGGPILRERPVVFAVPEAQLGDLAAILATRDKIHAIPVEELRLMIPAVRPGYAAGAAIEFGNHDIDVEMLLQGYLRGARRRGAEVAFRRRTQRVAREAGVWRVETTGGVVRAPVVVNAAGAWGDEVAAQAGIRPLGLVPKRRTAVLVDPAPYDAAPWPRLYDARRSWYCKPDAGRLMVSPADATPDRPHDVQPEEIDIAIAIGRMQEVLDIEVRRVVRAWAGLRTFAPDGAFAFGEAAEGGGFFWFVGQGGDGILTSPAAGRLLADLVAGRPPAWLPAAVVRAVDPRRFG